MKTIIQKVNRDNPALNMEVFNRAAEILKSGGLVAFPTETVYGLGANALDARAVKKIYEAKGRPSDNPLIVHIAELSSLYQLVSVIPKKAEIIIKNFWPGPITLIFKKSDLIPYEVTGGLDSVAVRFPSDITAELLIKSAGVPIAAPSANTSGRPSPTEAAHVIDDLDSKIDMIIDGGSCVYGLESTILDVSGEIPCLLRPGSVTKDMIEEKTGDISIDKSITIGTSQGVRPKAPGMKYTHYSPEADVIIVKGSLKNTVDAINNLIDNDVSKNIKTGVIATNQTKDFYKQGKMLIIGNRDNPTEIASNLFKILRRCDYLKLQRVYIEAFDENGLGLAIMNRLKKAAGYKIINV